MVGFGGVMRRIGLRPVMFACFPNTPLRHAGFRTVLQGVIGGWPRVGCDIRQIELVQGVWYASYSKG